MLLETFVIINPVIIFSKLVTECEAICREYKEKMSSQPLSKTSYISILRCVCRTREPNGSKHISMISS
jgi:hypothetical protein